VKGGGGERSGMLDVPLRELLFVIDRAP